MSQRFLTGKLEFDTALHIGQGKGGRPVDSVLRRTVSGEYILPGRAIGGALRTIATRLAPQLGFKMCKALEPVPDGQPCGCDVCSLFGELYPDENDDPAKGGAAAALWIADALLAQDQVERHVRDGVGLERASRTAAPNVKYDYEVVPRGTVFPLRIRWVVDITKQEQHAQLLAAALGEWENGRGNLGASAARGLGRFHLKELRCRRLELETSAALRAYLGAAEPWEQGSLDKEWWDKQLQAARESIVDNNAKRKSKTEKPVWDATVTRGWVAVEFEVFVDGPFLINDPLVAQMSGFDHAPLLEIALPHAGKPILSGSSLRGALRARAEKIARTLAMLKWQTAGEFLRHCPACDPLVREAGEPLASCDARSTIDDREETPAERLCLSCQLFGSPRRGSRLGIMDAHWIAGEPNATDWHPQDFLAIDRFMGAGKDSAKFDAVPLTKARFQGRMLLHDPEDWDLGWLCLVLRDLAEGEMTLGFGGAKGYGRARADTFKWQISYLDAEDGWLRGISLDGAKPDGVFQVVRSEPSLGIIADSWKGSVELWLAAFKTKCEGFAFDPDENLKKDTFLDQQVLYDAYGMPRAEIRREVGA